MFWNTKSDTLIDASAALSGRGTAMPIEPKHFVSGQPLKGPYPNGTETVYFGMGCFWGAERLFWLLDGVFVTAVGYQGGFTPNPTYEEVCSGKTGHTEAVKVVFDPEAIPVELLLSTFWEQHDPTQGMAQGNDVGSQYRSAIYTTSDAQARIVAQSNDRFAAALGKRHMGNITTEIAPAKEFYFAETHHQQYLAKNPRGYCGLSGTGVSCPVPHL